MSEDGPDGALEQVGREFPGELELDTARGGADRRESPLAVEAAKGPGFQRDDDRLGRTVRIVGREMHLDAVIVNVDARGLAAGMLLDDARALAPRQELRVERDIVDELEHLRGAEGNQHGFLDAGHKLK